MKAGYTTRLTVYCFFVPCILSNLQLLLLENWDKSLWDKAAASKLLVESCWLLLLFPPCCNDCKKACCDEA